MGWFVCFVFLEVAAGGLNGSSLEPEGLNEHVSIKVHFASLDLGSCG